jgi:PHS family inorganic phosphate transporter-like MFS transporter
MTTDDEPEASVLARLDETKLNRFQLKIMFISGMGFFTDAYDLFVIGIAVAILKTQWHLSTTEVSLLSSTTLAASAFGAVIFGRIADIFGRKKLYGIEVLILAVGAIATAFAPSIGWLIAFRVVLGIGIGGDYPVSSTIMSEYSGKRSRGQLVSLVFAMQAAGLVVGPLIAVVLLASGLSHDMTWRILLGLGAIPGLAVFHLRRRIHETPRFALAGGATDEAAAAVARATGLEQGTLSRGATVHVQQSVLSGWRTLLTNRTLRKWLIGTSMAWFMMDFAYYGNTIASPQIVSLLQPSAALIDKTLITLGIFAVFAVPGYIVAILAIERLGRRRIQWSGFVMMALTFGVIAAVPVVTNVVLAFLIIFGISYFFTQFGPNTTTFVYPAELFPVKVRTSGNGIAVALGKLGGFAGTYLFPVMLTSWGIRGAEGIAAAAAVCGLLFTLAFLPEPKGKSLEELTAMADIPVEDAEAADQAEPAPLPVEA